MNIGKTLKLYRKAKQLTGEELGKLSQTGQATISDIERGGSPRINTLEKICSSLDISLIDFLSVAAEYKKTPPSSDELELITIYKKLNKDQKLKLLEFLNTII